MSHESVPAGTEDLRRMPRQERSALMLARIERAAIEVIAEVGRDSFTTTAVAKRAGCSVGAVYRLFSDRLAILDWVYPNRSQSLGPIRDGVGEVRQLVLIPQEPSV